MKIARPVVLTLCLAALALCAWLKPLDSPAAEQVDAGLKRALLGFAAARTLNGAISVLQGTQIGLQPGGVGATFTPGQLLAPVNGLVKHFSDLMLLASVAFGVQKALISIGGDWAISLVLTATAVGWVASCFRQHHAPAWLSKTLVILLMLRFAMPIVALGSDMLSQQFLAADYVASQQAIGTVSGQVAGSPALVTAGNQGWLERMKEWLSKNADVKARFEHLRQAAEQATEHIIKLIVIFLLQTLLMPLLLLWGLFVVAKAAFRLPGQPSKVSAK